MRETNSTYHPWMEHNSELILSRSEILQLATSWRKQESIQQEIASALTQSQAGKVDHMKEITHTSAWSGHVQFDTINLKEAGTAHLSEDSDTVYTQLDPTDTEERSFDYTITTAHHHPWNDALLKKSEADTTSFKEIWWLHVISTVSSLTWEMLIATFDHTWQQKINYSGSSRDALAVTKAWSIRAIDQKEVELHNKTMWIHIDPTTQNEIQKVLCLWDSNGFDKMNDSKSYAYIYDPLSGWDGAYMTESMYY